MRYSFSPSLGRSAPSRQPSGTTQTTLGAFGITTKSPDVVPDDDTVSGTAKTNEKRPVRARKPTAKVKEALASSGARAKAKVIRRTVVSSDDEDNQGQPPTKKKKRTNVSVPSDADTEVSLANDPPNALRPHVFPRVSEDSRDICANRVPSNSNDLGAGSTEEEVDASDARGRASDEEWEFSQLDEMATNDAKVSS